MFSAIKKFFGKPAADVMELPASSRSTASAPAFAPAARVNGAHPAQNGSSVRPVTLPGNAPASLPIPLKSILVRLPADLAQRLRPTELGEAVVNVPMQKILAQIATGAVKISFAELRHLSPPGAFTSDSARDSVMVDVPLSEILTRLNPALLPRRASQRHVAVPAEITGPFGGQAQITFTTAPLKAAPAQPVAEPEPAPAPEMVLFTPIRSTPPAQPAPQRQPVATPYQPIQPARTVPAQPFQPSIAVAQATAAVRPAVAPARPTAAPLPAAAQMKPAVKPALQQTPPPVPQVPQFRAAPVTPITPTPPAAQAPNGLFQAAPPVEVDDELDTALFNRVSVPTPAAPKQPVSRQVPIAPQKPAVAPALKPAKAPLPELEPFQPFQKKSAIAPAVPAAPVAEVAAVAPITPIAPEPEPEPTPIPFNPPAPAPAPMPSIAGETRFLNVAIAEVSPGWPEAIQQEIAANQLGSALIGLPFGVTELAIKQGKVALPWRILRSWIKPPQLGTTSPNDAVVLELPLKIITPLFLAELRAAKPQKKLSMDENIPDLFSNKKQAEPAAPNGAHFAPVAPTSSSIVPPAAPAPAISAASLAPIATRMTAPVGLPTNAPAPEKAPLKPADTNYFTKQAEGQVEEVAPPVKPGPTPGTAFLNRYATPNEIVSKAAALEGVDGALIALPDGLLVANRIPSSMNADTIAAFLPQIFGRVSQCTKELRLGDLNNLNFTVGSVPWKIFKVGAIYFAAFGRPGEAFPTAQLAGIAAELDRKAK